MSSNQQNPENGHPGNAAPGWPEAGDAPQAASPEFITAQLVPDSQAAIRPVWTAIAVCVAAIIISAITSGIVLVVAALVARGPQVLQDVPRLLSWVEKFGGTPQGLLVLLLPAQLVFLSMACGAALLSPHPFVSRLSLGRGVLPLWTWLVFTIGTPIVGIFSSMTLSMFVTELSENLKLIESMMRANAQTSLPMLLVLVAVTPGFIEELMFRGYLQTRLAERFSPWGAITLSAVIFSAAHLDLIHAIGVLPLGLWLGAVAWRAESIWPAAICHMTNNAVAVLDLKYQPAAEVGVAMGPATIGILIVCGPAFLLSLYIFRSR